MFQVLVFRIPPISVTSNNQKLKITLKEQQTQLDEIVISASRTPERLFESPVTVERFGLKETKTQHLLTFMMALKILKA